MYFMIYGIDYLIDMHLELLLRICVYITEIRERSANMCANLSVQSMECGHGN